MNNRSTQKRLTALLETIQAALPGAKITIAFPTANCGFNIESKWNDGQQLRLIYSLEDLKEMRNKTITKTFVASVNAFRFGIKI